METLYEFVQCLRILGNPISNQMKQVFIRHFEFLVELKAGLYENITYLILNDEGNQEQLPNGTKSIGFIVHLSKGDLPRNRPGWLAELAAGVEELLGVKSSRGGIRDHITPLNMCNYMGIRLKLILWIIHYYMEMTDDAVQSMELYSFLDGNEKILHEI